ncbi:hypothetical protein EB796_003371 [Bugula neritina]|uniref:Uncharacterized protein n=1 Tax=Bugula neritina TaxID=10212 RepID=A0A7J7KI11_BUGNE|nr:hypothetical protein EB796_003371 [Bugula neritina]
MVRSTSTTTIETYQTNQSFVIVPLGDFPLHRLALCICRLQYIWRAKNFGQPYLVIVRYEAAAVDPLSGCHFIIHRMVDV